MKRKVLVSVISNNDMEDKIEVITPGVLEKDGDAIKVAYEETKISGMEGTTTSIIINKDDFILERVGTTNTRMEFKKDTGTIAMYNTPYGILDMSIFTNEILLNVDEEKGGKIKAKYDMSIGGQNPIKTNIEINIKVNN